MRHLSWGVLGLVAQHGFSQATQDDNLGGVGSFLGWNAGANQILEVKNEANKRIEFYTNAARRMMLSPTLTNQTVNGFSGLDLSGFLGVGDFGNALVNQPQAMLHQDGWGD